MDRVDCLHCHFAYCVLLDRIIVTTTIDYMHPVRAGERMEKPTVSTKHEHYYRCNNPDCLSMGNQWVVGS